MCQEIRTEVPASFYVPNVKNADIYYFRPQKIYMVNCSREVTAGMVTGCWPQHCREKYGECQFTKITYEGGSPRTESNFLSITQFHIIQFPQLIILDKSYSVPKSTPMIIVLQTESLTYVTYKISIKNSNVFNVWV